MKDEIVRKALTSIELVKKGKKLYIGDREVSLTIVYAKIEKALNELIETTENTKVLRTTNQLFSLSSSERNTLYKSLINDLEEGEEEIKLPKILQGKEIFIHSTPNKDPMYYSYDPQTEQIMRISSKWLGKYFPPPGVLEYKPHSPKVIEVEGGNIYNLWSPPKAVLEAPYSGEGLRPEMEALLNIFVGDSRKAMEHWAYRVITSRNNWVPVILGNKGIGKGLFVDSVGACIGQDNVAKAHNKFGSDNFNIEMFRCMVYVMDELTITGYRYNSLKAMMAEYMSGTSKGADSNANMKIFCSPIITSNNFKDNYTECPERRTAYVDTVRETFPPKYAHAVAKGMKDPKWVRILLEYLKHPDREWMKHDHIPYQGEVYWECLHYWQEHENKIVLEALERSARHDQGDFISLDYLKQQYKRVHRPKEGFRDIPSLNGFLDRHKYFGEPVGEYIEGENPGIYFFKGALARAKERVTKNIEKSLGDLL